EAGQSLHVELGVVDAVGHEVPGVNVSARLDRITYGRVAEKAESGAVVERWRDKAKAEGSCDVPSGAAPVGCDLPVGTSGSYRVTAIVDGRDDATASYWAYGNNKDDKDDEGVAASGVPSSGKKIPLVLDKTKYKSGETAKVFVQSPFKKAIALLTVEQGGLLKQESKRLEGPSAVFEVPVSAANAPWMHAAVTVLPVGEAEADYRVGAVRIPVSADDAKLNVAVSSAQKKYEPRDDAEITVEVKRADGAPVKNADVILAVVDEGVLRMTQPQFHAKDPATALRPGRGLDFVAFDSRGVLLKRRERAHVAGDGEGGEEDALDVRKNFVETAAWLPDLVTDEHGRVTAKVKLPDNLTEFRMMAVAVDDDGAGGNAEAGFTVSKSLMMEPILPHFALRGDSFEVAAMVHNDTDAPVAAKVTLAGQTRELTVPARGRERVSVPMTAERPLGARPMAFALEAGGKVRDKVEVSLRIDEAGIDEHPQLAGAFLHTQEIDVAIPADAAFEEGAALAVKTGSSLYPELGQRLQYLLDYPHGCVEQTTSSTLPLVAARMLLPWTGTTAMEDAELRKRIKFGVDHLASMQTSGGGLAYWPGGTEPNWFGSAYAMHVLVRAKEMGIEHPKLIEGVSKYLVERLGAEDKPEIRVAIAEALAGAGALPEGSADMLYDARNGLSPFGLASLGIALSSLPKQEDRTKDVLDRLEASFDAQGESTFVHGEKDWEYWGSTDRDRAQAVIALTKLRKTSKLAPMLATRLARGVERWTTQSTAWSLLGLADYVGTRTPDGAVNVRVELDGHKMDTFQKLGGDNKEVHIPLKDLAGKRVTLRLTGDEKKASAFTLEARYRRPFGAADTRLARRGPSGVSIHRAFSDPAGKSIDLAHVKVGQVVRVAVRVALPKFEDWRLSYVAITDRVPAGFDPINPDLATTGSVPELPAEHPFYGEWHDGASATHVDLRNDRVQMYFDRTWGRTLHATYLARATTPGQFALPPASGEMMYEPGSEGWSDAGKVTVE
ncbi:MAG TPA: alpha-2-macroglobulin family protein, partial [Polyangiaceae bacterium]|nr:alpha-2-macroglobulin family protein [Polyangiaceae bacterium]